MKTFMTKYCRYGYGAMLILFLLPFFSVSCEGVTVASASGFDLVIGGELDGMIADMAKEGGGGDASFDGDLSVDPELWAIVLLAIVIVGLVLSLIKGAPKSLHGAVGLAGLVAIVMLYLKVTDGADLPSEAAEVEISVGMGFGLMGVTLGFVVMLIGGTSSLRRGPPGQ